MELTLFIIVGAIAVLSAVLMLISQNAVHSALFLVLNFACIAFFYLMLSASFLAMVQIVVYAGAIMVLFLFVIMLLGAERLLPERNPRFPWLVPMAIVLALVFLVAVSLAVIRGEVDLSERASAQPYIRVVNVVDQLEGGADVYLDGHRLVSGLEYGQASQFAPWDRGRYDVALYKAGADPSAEEPLATIKVDLNQGEAVSFTAVGTAADPVLVVANEDLRGASRSDALRVTVVNGVRAAPMIDVVRGTDASEDAVLINDLPYGEASRPTTISGGMTDISVFSEGVRRDRLVTFENRDLSPEQGQLWVFGTRYLPDNSYEDVFHMLETNALPSFGSPASVGLALFARYVLPMEMVALVLLVAMIGALILTKDMVGERRVVRRRLANPPPELQAPITPEATASRTTIEG